MSAAMTSTEANILITQQDPEARIHSTVRVRNGFVVHYWGRRPQGLPRDMSPQEPGPCTAFVGDSGYLDVRLGNELQPNPVTAVPMAQLLLMRQLKYELSTAPEIRVTHVHRSPTTGFLVDFTHEGKHWVAALPYDGHQSLVLKSDATETDTKRSEGVKHDADKLRFDLMPPRAEAEVVDVLTYGARKYAPDNWRKVPEPRRRYLAAARRHISAYQRGEKLDPESGKAHLAHAICSLLFMLELDKEDT